MKVTVKFRGGPLTIFFPNADGKSATFKSSLLYLSVRRLSHHHMRATVVVSIFLEAISYASRTWEDLRDFEVFRLLSPTFHQGSGTRHFIPIS